MGDNPIYKLLPGLNRTKQTNADTWIASCPTNAHQHGDRSQGLSITELKDGTLLLKCWAGCSNLSICDAVGLGLRDLFPTRPDQKFRRPPNGLTFTQRTNLCLLLEDEAYLIRFSRAYRKCGNQLTPKDMRRLLLADERVRKIKRMIAL